MSRGTNRYTDRVDEATASSPSGRAEEAIKGDDIYWLQPIANDSPKRRVGRRQLDELQDRLSDRDKQVLHSLQQFRLATTAQLQVFHFADHASDATARRVANRVLTRLFDLGAITKLNRRIGGFRAGSAGQVYTLTPVGHRLLGTEGRKRFHEPKAHHVHHTLAITDLAARLIERSRTDGLEIESLQTEPSAWRITDQLTLKPDLYLTVADEQTELAWFIEIDLATESSTVLTRKLQVYDDYWRGGQEQAANGIFPKVLWIAPDQTRAEFIARAIAEAVRRNGIEPQLFAVATTNQAIEQLTDFGEPDEDDNNQPTKGGDHA